MIDPWDERERINYIVNRTLKYVAIGLLISGLVGAGLGFWIGVYW